MGIYSDSKHSEMKFFWCPIQIDLSVAAIDPVLVINAAAGLSTGGNITIVNFLGYAGAEAVGNATTKAVSSLEYGGVEKATITWVTSAIGSVIKSNVVNFDITTAAMLEFIHKTAAVGGTTTGLVYLGISYVITPGYDYDQVGT